LWVRDGRIHEINDLASYFRSASSAKETDQVPVAGDGSAAQVSHETSSEGALLERIVDLEAKLDADRQRKTKFQKPRLQTQWQAELRELYIRLED
jgi:hypothetical protein